MKKIMLSGLVVGSFFIYSVLQRASKSEVSPVTVSQSANNTQGLGNMMGSGNGMMKTGAYKDGVYTGNAADAFYGNIQVKATVQNGKLTNVEFLQYPNDRDRSVGINQRAMPRLASEAIIVQSAQVDVVSGATDTSQAFIESLGNALNQAV